MKNLVVGVGVFALILGACGRAKPDRSRTIDPPKTETVKSDDQEAATKNIEEALLTINDMPSGWSDEKAPKFEVATEDECGNPLPSETGPVDGANATFSADPTSVTQVDHAVYRYETGEAAERFDALLESVNKCQKFEKDGTKVKVQALSYENVGDESIATRYVAKTEIGLTAIQDRVRWRRGDLSVVIGYTSFSPNLIELEKWVEKADRKLVALLEGE